MLRNLWKNWKNARDEKRLAQHQERDARLGTPTKATLDERAKQAAEKGYWKTALAAIDQGADVNQTVTFDYSDRSYVNIRTHSLLHVAIEQDNVTAVESLLARGARQDAVGTITNRVGPWGGDRRYAPVEFAAHQGA